MKSTGMLIKRFVWNILKQDKFMLCRLNQSNPPIITPQFVVHADDSGIPSKSVSIEAIITITRDEYKPEFVNAPYTAEDVSENTEVGVRVFALAARDQDQKVSERQYVRLHVFMKSEVHMYP